MAIHQTPSQRKTVKRVMHEYKHGELKTARGSRKVKDPKQAIAIALSEAGASKYDTPKERAHNLRRTKAKEKRGETAQAATEGRARAARTLAAASKPAAKSTRRASPTKTGTRKSASTTRRKAATIAQRKSATRARAARSATRTTARKSARKTTARKSATKTTARRSTANGKTRTELYAEASRRKIAGRSKMNKQQLERALHA
jgi:hypothetical protein